MKWSRLLVVMHVAALWPVVRWYVLRATEGVTDMWGLAALVAAVVLTIAAKAPEPGRSPRLAVPTALLVAFAVTWPFLPPFFGAILGVVSLVALVSEVRFATRVQPALLGLSLLAITSVSTLQFFVGWPFRVAVAAVVAPVLRAIGNGAVNQGTSIVIDGRAIVVDAPCSGVWLLWGAILVWLCLALARRMSARATAIGLVAMIPIVFVANAMRTLSLVLVETRPGFPGWTHEAVGFVVLAAAGAAIVLYSERVTRCAPRCST